MSNYPKTSKISALLLSIVMVGACAGCRGAKVNKDDGSDTSVIYEYEYEYEYESDEPGGSDTGSGNQASSNGGTASSGDINNLTGGNADFKEPVYDLGGRTITIASENDLAGATGIFAESVKLTQKKYNCTFKFIQKTDYQNLYQTLITDHSAGTTTYDVVELRGYDVYPNAAMSGAIRNVGKDYDFKSDPTWANQVFGSIGQFRNSYYGIPYTPNEMGVGIWYNKALFRQSGVKDPWEYVNSNQWTFDTFRSVCKSITKDTNSDGKPDIWAFTSEDPWLAFVSANGGSLMTMTSSGPKYALNSNNALKALEYVNTLFTDNTVPDGNELKVIASNPFNAMITGKVAMFTYHARYGAVLENAGIASSDIGWVYLPKGPSATAYTTATGTTPSMFVVPQAAKDPTKLVAAVQDLAAYWDTNRAIRHNVTDEIDSLYNALSSSIDANAKQVLYYQAENPTYTYANNYSLANTLQEKVWPDILGGKSPSTAVSSHAKELQSIMTARYEGKTVNN